jgi:flagellar biosynthesis protein FlhB
VADTEDRTLAATDRRRQQARAEGQAPLSREVVTASGLAAIALLLAMAAPSGALTLGRQLEAMLASPRTAPGAALWDAGSAILLVVLPIAGAVLLAGSAAALVQTGFLLHAGALVPNLGRLDPRKGLKRVFGAANAIEAVKGLAKVAVLGWAVWRTVAGTLANTAASLSWTTPTLLDHLARDILRVLLVVLGCQCVIALLDVAWVRFRFARQLRMSLEEVKQEQKETDGDPRLKAKLRQIRLARTRRRMLAAVAKATVVITNPTHYAVALAYERGTHAAPKVVAKGVDEVAARIRDAAEKHGVPLVPSPPLARALHSLRLDAEVPAEHFKAVAEIIAYVWRLRRPGRSGS